MVFRSFEHSRGTLRQDILEKENEVSASRAVLWDMDGTLIDSEEFHWISWRNTLANEGITITREQFLCFIRPAQ